MVNSAPLYLILLFTCLISGYLAAQPLKIVCHEFAPFSYQDQQQNITGILVEIARLACQDWPQGCEIELLPNKRAKQQFNQGLAHGHFQGWNEERALTTWFSIPLLQTEYGFYSPLAQPLTDLKQTSGKNIGAFGPSNTLTSLINIDRQQVRLGLPPMEIILSSSGDEQPLKMLHKRRFDAYYVNKEVGAYYAKHLGLNDLYYLSSGQPIHYFIGFKMKHNEYETIKAFNHLLVKLYQNHRFDEIFAKWKMIPSPLLPTEFPDLNVPY
ncbi:extracellular solute-binding protein, family 3 [Shewanella sediminis HAW-EB3]|uniref:Extracellular solute-binding protein, family 3 n=1 Tax=Shewanella sediminis (strain HAW-EB3) TaxID=425104 RepID=A8G153_SHESH|nr:extracellular solute-binding protein, family 3 [Shewanella sediminis HAW-EB3]